MNRKVTETALNSAVNEMAEKAAGNVLDRNMAAGMKKCLELLGLDRPEECTLGVDPVVESLIRDSEKLRIIESLGAAKLLTQDLAMVVCGYALPVKTNAEKQIDQIMDLLNNPLNAHYLSTSEVKEVLGVLPE